MADNFQNSGNHGDEMGEYLQTFLDETEEQLDGLVETMLSLEQDSTSADDLNEAFRLIHSIKGSAGMLGLDNITVLTHQLESRFERFRSGLAQLDEPTMNLVLRCIDFLRHCIDQLRDGQQLGSPSELLDDLRRLEENAEAQGTEDAEDRRDRQQDVEADTAATQSAESPDHHEVEDGVITMVVRFRAGLPLADLKAQLIVARMSGLGNVQSTRPAVHQLSDTEQIEKFEVRIETDADLDRLRAAADVEGVESIEVAGEVASGAADTDTDADAPIESVVADANETAFDQMIDELETPQRETGESESSVPESKTTAESESEPDGIAEEGPTQAVPPLEAKAAAAATTPHERAPTAEPPVSETLSRKVADTMRVDIDRLDNLMNLVGELVVNRARFAQISAQIDPALRRATMLNRIREFSDGLRRTIEGMEHPNDASADWSAQIQQLRAGLELLDEQSEIWESGRQSLSQMSEAIDQLSRVSNNLQRGVMDTRMVPVGPLFSRFKRVIRDLSKDRGKKVDLLVRGENTELDKRMIDELGDPLVHLVRNSLDHGLEQPDVRNSRGKPEAGTIFLEASHSGNNVHIVVRDDGGGIDVEKIKAKLIGNRVLSESAANELSDEQALDYIWHPGFSTAQEVTDVSGRGVGMDVVRARIHQLNGTVEVSSTPLQGTTFTIRLPLTLAIINSLLVRRRNVVFSIPIDDVREIVSIDECDIVTVQKRRTFEVRGEFILLVSLDDVFQWHKIDYGYETMAVRQTDSRRLTSGSNDGPDSGDSTDSESLLAADYQDCQTLNGSQDESFEVVILHSAGQTIGLRVDELRGNQDVVIKSLADNFTNIRGLSGASILGDGSVCLMLDTGKVIGMATKSTRVVATGELDN